VVTVGVNGRLLLHPGTGRERFLRNILKGCARDIRMIVAVPGRTASLREEFPDLELVEVLSGGSGRVWDRRFTQYLPVDVDVIFQPHFCIPATGPGQKLVVTVHDLINLEYLNFRNFFTGRFPYRLLSPGMIRDGLMNRREIQKAWQVVTVSSYVADQISNRLAYPQDSLHIINNGIDPGFLVADAEEAVAARLLEFGLSRGEYLLYVGGMVYRKNVGRLVKAFRTLSPQLQRRYPLVLVGRGYWRKRLEKLPLQGIVFLDSLTNSELKALYQGAAAVVYPSIAEGFGLPVFEAAMLSAPVAASGISAPGTLASGFARLFDPFSSASIRDALQDLLEQPERWKISSEGRERIMREFSWSSAAGKYMDIFRQGGPHGGVQEAGQSFQV